MLGKFGAIQYITFEQTYMTFMDLVMVKCGMAKAIVRSVAMYGTAQFKLYTYVQVHACACTFNAYKTSKPGMCARTVAHDFGVCTRESKHTQHTRDARHKLALSLPHYTCGVTTHTVAVGNEIQLLCS